MPKKRKSIKYVAVANLLSLSVQDVIKYVRKLHEHIAKQNKKLSNLRLKVKKLVSLSQKVEIRIC